MSSGGTREVTADASTPSFHSPPSEESQEAGESSTGARQQAEITAPLRATPPIDPAKSATTNEFNDIGQHGSPIEPVLRANDADPGFSKNAPNTERGTAAPEKIPVLAVLEQASRLEPRAHEEFPGPSGGTRRSIVLVASALVALTAVLSVIYYVSGSTMREFNELLARNSLVNSGGPSAYSVYVRAVQEKGPTSSLVLEMQTKVQGILDAKSHEVFQTYYQESETGQLSWEDIERLQDWLNQIQHSQESLASLEYASGMNELFKRNYLVAKGHFENALSHKPNWPLALNGLGRAYFNLHDFRQAEHYYLLASAADPEWKFPYSNLGNLYRDALGNFEEAERNFQKAISLDPSRSSFHFNLGSLYFTRGKQYWPQACNEFRQSLEASSAKSLSPSEASLASQRMGKSCKGT